MKYYTLGLYVSVLPKTDLLRLESTHLGQPCEAEFALSRGSLRDQLL